MCKKTSFIIVLICCATLNMFAQRDTVYQLEEVIIKADKRVLKHSLGQKVRLLKDSVLLNNVTSFTDVLRFNSSVYFKEYGAGGTSTISFRGTDASNTAVIWNGININSPNNGQTGFNSLSVNLFDELSIRSGGGSLEYGSGATGGTIHLSNNLRLTNKTENKHQLFASLGSFDTYNTVYKYKLSASKLALNIGLSHNQSDNDYKLLSTNFRNSNGAYNNTTVDVSAAFKLNKFYKIKFYASNYFGERFFSGELPNPTSAKEKYKNFHHRNLLVYTYNKANWNNEVKIGYLTQEYQYFNNKNSPDFSFGKSRRYVVSNMISYRFFNDKATISSFTDFERTYGKTDRIVEQRRDIWSQSFVYKQSINESISFETKIRKDFNSDYNVPFSYGLGAKFKINNQKYIRVNSSKNYRVPTFNDLYWPGQGNLNLVPETSYQAELGFGFKGEKVMTDIGLYYIRGIDKISWVPNADPNRPGVWVPINIGKTSHKGIELELNIRENFNQHRFHFQLNYNYTLARNEETNTFLIYVPKHVVNANLSYSYRKVSVFYQQLFNDQVFTTESNSENFTVPFFFVANLGVNYHIQQNLTAGIKVNNLYNEKYEIITRRPMRNRNINFNINYKF